MDSFINEIIDKFKEALNLDGRKRVFEDGYKLSSDFLIEKSDPEAFTKEFLIDKILRKFDLEKLPEKHLKRIKESIHSEIKKEIINFDNGLNSFLYLFLF